MNGCTLLKSPSLCLSERVGGRLRKDKSQFSHLNENPSFSLHFVFECTNTIVQENVKLRREFDGRPGKEYIMDTFSHPRLSMKLLLERFLAVEEIYWGKSFASWIFYQGASQDFFSEFSSNTRGEKRKQDFHWEICPEEKANSPRRAPGMVWTASEVELTPSASLQQKVVRWILYTILNTLQFNTWLNARNIP